MTKEILTKYCVTRNDVAQVERDFNDLLSYVYLNDAVSQKNMLRLFNTYKDLLEELGFDPKGDISVELRKNTATLKEKLSNSFQIEYMLITLSYMPSYDFLLKLKKLFHKGNNILPVFDVKIDPSILGGIKIDYKGKHTNLSVQKLIDDYFRLHKNEILSAL